MLNFSLATVEWGLSLTYKFSDEFPRTRFLPFATLNLAPPATLLRSIDSSPLPVVLTTLIFSLAKVALGLTFTKTSALELPITTSFSSAALI